MMFFWLSSLLLSFVGWDSCLNYLQSWLGALALRMTECWVTFKSYIISGSLLYTDLCCDRAVCVTWTHRIFTDTGLSCVYSIWNFLSELFNVLFPCRLPAHVSGRQRRGMCQHLPRNAHRPGEQGPDLADMASGAPLYVKGHLT